MSFYNDRIYQNVISEKTINKILKTTNEFNKKNKLFSYDSGSNSGSNIGSTICTFISNNIVILIIFICICLILYYRYNDVQKKKIKK